MVEIKINLAAIALGSMICGGLLTYAALKMYGYRKPEPENPEGKNHKKRSISYTDGKVIIDLKG